jgi:hypothetical protein
MLLQSTPNLSPHSVLPSATLQASSWHSCAWTMPIPAALTWPSRRLAPRYCSTVFPVVLSSTSHSLAHHSTVGPCRSQTLSQPLTTSGIQETNGGLVIFGGSLPLYKDDFLLGSIGVSGGSPDQDLEVAQAGVDWLINSE